MTGNKYSAVRRSIAKLLASKEGRDTLAHNHYKSGTPIIPALADEPLGEFYKKVDQVAEPGQVVVAAVLIRGNLHMARVTPTRNNTETISPEQHIETIPADPKATVGMLFDILINQKQLAVRTQPFDYQKYGKVAVSFEMPERGDSLQSA